MGKIILAGNGTQAGISAYLGVFKPKEVVKPVKTYSVLSSVTAKCAIIASPSPVGTNSILLFADRSDGFKKANSKVHPDVVADLKQRANHDLPDQCGPSWTRLNK